MKAQIKADQGVQKSLQKQQAAEKAGQLSSQQQQSHLNSQYLQVNSTIQSIQALVTSNLENGQLPNQKVLGLVEQLESKINERDQRI